MVLGQHLEMEELSVWACSGWLRVLFHIYLSILERIMIQRFYELIMPHTACPVDLLLGWKKVLITLKIKL